MVVTLRWAKLHREYHHLCGPNSLLRRCVGGATMELRSLSYLWYLLWVWRTVAKGGKVFDLVVALRWAKLCCTVNTIIYAGRTAYRGVVSAAQRRECGLYRTRLYLFWVCRNEAKRGVSIYCEAASCLRLESRGR
jgi:hypothetical protein